MGDGQEDKGKKGAGDAGNPKSEIRNPKKDHGPRTTDHATEDR
jgi:hypothetical protein